MSTSSLRRQVKNIVHNYSEAEIKVREATSNDPWGPSGSLMCELADLTYNVLAFTEIMGMIWRRLNDHGKNWRHVYKALTLAEYLIKTGSERVAQQCRENVYAVQTLRDFQYVDRDGKDQGVNVREKAKQIVALLKDEEKLREERAQALKTKEKMAQVATATAAPSAPSTSTLREPPEAVQAWPQSSGEEELQLQLALAMSKEEADQKSPPPQGDDLQMQLAMSLSKEEHDKEERLRRGDDLRLQMAIEESQKQNVPLDSVEKTSLMDLADVFSSPGPPQTAADPWRPPPLGPLPIPLPSNDPWGSTGPPQPWGASGAGHPATATENWDILGPPATVSTPSEPWGGPVVPPPSLDPWASLPLPLPLPQPTLRGPWDSTEAKTSQSSAPLVNTGSAQIPTDPFTSPSVQDDFSDFDSLRAVLPRLETGRDDIDLLAGDSLPVSPTLSPSPTPRVDRPLPQPLPLPPPARKTPESFLGPGAAALVDLEALVVAGGGGGPRVVNPFLTGSATTLSSTNPFDPSHPAPSLNQLRVSPLPLASSLIPSPALSPLPSLSPLNGLNPHPHPNSTSTTNPFLL